MEYVLVGLAMRNLRKDLRMGLGKELEGLSAAVAFALPMVSHAAAYAFSPSVYLLHLSRMSR